jgi:hypothetical protein
MSGSCRNVAGLKGELSALELGWEMGIEFPPKRKFNDMQGTDGNVRP